MSNSSTRFHLPFGHMMESVRLLIDIPWSSSCLAHAEKKKQTLGYDLFKTKPNVARYIFFGPV